jgi:predicted secreted protein
LLAFAKQQILYPQKGLVGVIMNRTTILALAMIFSSVMVVSGTSICDNTPCEPQINASLGREFTISLESTSSTGFEWWTEFDPNYLSLTNSTLASGTKKSELLGVPETKMFTFNTLIEGQTDVIMLLLKPWENGTIAERKIFPIEIVSKAIAPKKVIVLDKSINLERNGKSSNAASNGQTTTASYGTSSNYFTNESSMETPSQAASESAPSSHDLSSLSKTSF